MRQDLKFLGFDVEPLSTVGLTKPQELQTGEVNNVSIINDESIDDRVGSAATEASNLNLDNNSRPRPISTAQNNDSELLTMMQQMLMQQNSLRSDLNFRLDMQAEIVTKQTTEINNLS